MKTALLLFFLLTVRVWGEEIRLSGPSLAMRFEHTQRRLALMQIGKEGDKPLLCSDREGNSAFWNHGTFTEPLTRFVYPRMNAFESWGYGDDTALLFNAVNGFPIYAHNSHTETMAPYSRRVRDYYDVYPEITDAQMSERVPACPSCLAAIFEGNKTIVTVANPKGAEQSVDVQIPTEGTILFDRYTGQRIAGRHGEFHLAMQPWEFRAFEIRP